MKQIQKIYWRNLIRKVLLFIFSIQSMSFVEVNSNKDLESIALRLSDNKYKTTIKLNLYSDGSLEELIQTSSIFVNCFNNFMHYKTEDVEFFSDANYAISIHHKNKLILVNPNILENSVRMKKNAIPFVFKIYAEELFDSELVETSGDVRTYRIRSKVENSELQYVDFKLNTFTKHPITCTLKYNQSLEALSGYKTPRKSKNKLPVLNMVYNDFEYREKINKNEFTYSHVLSIQKGKQLMVKPAFKGYQIINYLNQSKRK